MNKSVPLSACLPDIAATTMSIIKTDGNAIVLDLSSGSQLQGQEIAGLDAKQLGKLIDVCMSDAQTDFAFGRYGEPRDLYSNDNFTAANGGESRTIHLGIDLFCKADTPVFAPLDGTVEIVTNNDRDLDYGPLVILRHAIDSDRAFFTLYGHLSLDTLERVTAGQNVRAGQQIASVGSPPTNGNWPPHLHLQVIDDLMDFAADFPGVACRSEMQHWMRVSPSPAIFFPDCAAHLLEYK